MTSSVRIAVLAVALASGCYDFSGGLGKLSVFGADGTPIGDVGPWEPALRPLLGDWALVVKQGNEGGPPRGTALGSRPPMEVLADGDCRPVAVAVAVPEDVALDPTSFSYWGFVVNEAGDCPVYAPTARSDVPSLSKVLKTAAVGMTICEDAPSPQGALVFLGPTDAVVRAAWLPWRGMP